MYEKRQLEEQAELHQSELLLGSDREEHHYLFGKK